MLKKIFESTLIMGTSSLLVMSLDLVRIKIVAVLLGPTGVGTLSILNHYHVLAATFLGLGLGPGIAKYVATFGIDGNYGAQARVLSNSIRIVLLLSISGFIFTIIFSTFISEKIFADSSYAPFLIIYAFSFPLAVYPSITGSFLQGLKRIKEMALINVLRSSISLLILIPVVYFFRLKGAVYSVLIVTIVHLVLNRYFIKKEKRQYGFSDWFAFDKDLLGKLLKYGITSLIVGTAYYLSHMILKIIIVDSLGLKMNGIYQPIWALTMTYLTLVLSSMSAYSFPKLCELKALKDITEELNAIIRVAVLLIMPVMFILIIGRKPIILILYSSKFLLATDYMPIQIVGDFFKLLFWALGMYLLPTKRLYAFISFNLLIDILLVVFAYNLVDLYQLNGVTASFASSHAIGFFALYIYSKRKIKFQLWSTNRLLLFTSFGALILIIASERYFSLELYLSFIFFVVITWGLISVRKKEALQLKNYFSIKLSKKLTVSSIL